MSIRQCLSRLENVTGPAEPVTCRMYWSNDDGVTATDARTGEIITLADFPDMIELNWGDDAEGYDDDAT